MFLVIDIKSIDKIVCMFFYVIFFAVIVLVEFCVI